MMTLQALPPEQVRRVLAEAVRETITHRLAEARPGHCLRVSTLPETVMHNLCADLTANHPGADVVLLLGPWQQPSAPWQVSATRLIELRNAEARPLLVFVPPGIKTAAEDSFDVSTFVEMDLGDIPAQLRHRLRAQLPEELQWLTDRAIGYLGDTERIITDDDVVRYYLTILHNQTSEACETFPEGDLWVEVLQVAGGAIYQLHLIPDFDLYQVADRVKLRLSRNVAVLRTLIQSANPLLGRIHELKLKANTIQADLYAFLRQQTLDAVSTWGAAIATDPDLRHLAFDQWQFEGEAQERERLLLYVDDLDLPARDRETPIGPDNPRYLDVKRATRVRIKWVTDPKPAAVDDLAYFRVEIVSTDPAGGAIAWESKNIPVGKSSQASRSTTLKVADFRDQFAEPEADGLYFFRVRAYSASGDILNEENAEAHPEILRDPRNPESKRHNESEDVWFWVDPGEEPPPAEPPRNVSVESFLEAQLLARLAAIDRGDDPFSARLVPQPERSGWATAKGKRAEATYNIVYDAQTRFTLPVSNRLRQIESDTLRHPESLGRWRLNLAGECDRQSVDAALRPYHAPERVPPAFLRARASLFAAIRGGDADRLTATVDLSDFADQILAYAQAYADWLAQAQADFAGQAIRDEDGRKRTDPLFLDLDTVEILLPGDGPAPDRLYLLAPTHPLRLLWHLQRANLVNAWLRLALGSTEGAGRASQALNANVRVYLRRGLAPVNLPPALRASHNGHPEGVSHFYVEHGPLTPFWGLYLREDVKDSRTLEARVRGALGISRQASASGEIGYDVLAHNLLRYLVQHPYVNTLKINVFNPGDASLVVDAILAVERERLQGHLPELRYELRLFTHGERVDDVGEAVDELLNPERQVSAEADAFVVASRNPLYPKLHFSRNNLKDFLARPEAYEAHLSTLYDLFPVEVTLQPLDGGRSSFLHGLLQEQVTHFAGDEAHYAWQRQLAPAPCRELPHDAHAISGRLAALLSQISNLQASVAAGKVVSAVPTLRLNLELHDKNLLYQVHAVSDWVLTVDRHLGLEYFDSDAPDDRPVYLLDFRPEFGGGDIERLLLTTRSVDEIRRLIRPALEDYDLLVGEDVEVYFLRLLRSLSGRLALKLLSAPTQVSEALGLAMARLFLEQYNLLEDRIVLPLDAHTDLFAEAGREDPLREEVSLQRGDLLLVSCDPSTRTLRFQVVEVKFQADLGGFSAYIGLQQRIEGQITNSQEVLRQHFDPHARPVDRLDRQVKVKELISLLSFYLARSHRYGLVSEAAVGPLRAFIESLDEADHRGRLYRLECTGAGLIFDLGHQGLDVHEEHPGLVFYRVGGDYVRRLLNNGLRRRALLQGQAQEKGATIEEAERQAEARQRIVRDTTLRGDPSYQRVRTHFDVTPAPEIGPIPERAEKLQVPPSVPPAKGKVSHEPEAEPEAAPVAPSVEPPAEPAGVTPEPEQSAEIPEWPPEEPVAPAQAEEMMAGASYDVLLGETGESRQYGLLGLATGRRVALDLNGTNTISLFGVQGSGKSYTVGSVVEMAAQPLPGVNLLPSPLATVIFHYHESQDYPPEFVSMVEPNSAEAEVEVLAQEYGAHPARLEDVIILTSPGKLPERQAEFPSVRVEPLYFASDELSFKDWRFLMGAVGNQMYMKQINMIMRELRRELTLDALRAEIDESDLSEGQKRIARVRLDIAAQFIQDSRLQIDATGGFTEEKRRLSNWLRPGRLIIVDLRDEFIDKDEALGLFVVMLNIFANAGREAGASPGGRPFNKLIVFDEAHKYMDNPDLTGHIVEVIRQMRHQGVSVLIASQDPPSLPNAIIELSSLVILHRFNSPQWLKHVQRSITSLADLTPAQMAALRPGEAFVWANKATERIFTQKAVKMRFRPRVTQHGGETKRAV
jgi:DNA phosphorothioation-dependent restriction protein DptH